MKKHVHILVLCLMTFVFAACEQVAIVHELSERDANKIIVLLAKNNIASKIEKSEKSQKVDWSVTVEPEDEIAARSILVANNLPKVKHGGLSGICKDTPLIMSPETEKCRKILAYKEEIINSLESIRGVVSADVVLNIPDVQEYPDEDSLAPRPTAAATVQYLKEPSMTSYLTEGKVQEFVSNSVSGLDARDVAVIITYLEPVSGGPEQTENGQNAAQVSETATHNTATQTPSTSQDDELAVEDENTITIGGLTMDEESAKKFKVVAILFLVLFLLLTTAFIFVLLRMARLKKQVSVGATPVDEDELADQKLLGT